MLLSQERFHIAGGFEPGNPAQLRQWAREKMMKKTVTMNILLRFAIVCNFLQNELH